MESKKANDLKRTTGFAALGTKLFTNPDNFTAGNTEAVLQMAGVQIPKGVRVGTDVAQILVSGGAIASDVSTAASIGAFASPTAAIIAAAVDILTQTGLMQMDAQSAVELNLGVDLAMVVSSAGYNVVADIKLIFDFVMSLAVPDASAMAANGAQMGLQTYVKNRMSAEKSAMADNFADLHSGKINTYDLMIKCAEEAPELFYYYYPKLKTFIPPGKILITSTAKAVALGNWGISDTQVSNAYQTMDTVGFVPMDPPKLKQTWWGGDGETDAEFKKRMDDFNASVSKAKSANVSKVWDYITSSLLVPYQKMAVRYGMADINSRTFSMKSLAALSLLPPYIQRFDMKWDPFKTLSKFGLTFADLGEDWIVPTAVDKSLLGEEPTLFEGMDAVSIDGQLVYTDQVHANALLAHDRYARKKSILTAAHVRMMKADQMGDYSQMTKNMDRATYAHILKQATPDFGNPAFGAPNSPSFPQVSPDVIRDIRNYWTGIHFWEKMKDDPTLNPIKTQDDFTQFNYLSTSAEIDALAKSLNFKIIGRAMNKQAMANIALFLGVSADRIYVRNPEDLGKKPAIFGIR